MTTTLELSLGFEKRWKLFGTCSRVKCHQSISQNLSRDKKEVAQDVLVLINIFFLCTSTTTLTNELSFFFVMALEGKRLLVREVLLHTIEAPSSFSLLLQVLDGP